MAAVKRYAMANRYLVFEYGRMRAGTYVNDRAVLDIGAFADPNEIDVTANYRMVPNAGISADLNVADDDHIVRDKSCGMDLRQYFLERQDHRANFFRSIPKSCSNSLTFSSLATKTKMTPPSVIGTSVSSSLTPKVEIPNLAAMK